MASLCFILYTSTEQHWPSLSAHIRNVSSIALVVTTKVRLLCPLVVARLWRWSWMLNLPWSIAIVVWRLLLLLRVFSWQSNCVLNLWRWLILTTAILICMWCTFTVVKHTTLAPQMLTRSMVCKLCSQYGRELHHLHYLQFSASYHGGRYWGQQYLLWRST